MKITHVFLTIIILSSCGMQSCQQAVPLTLSHPSTTWEPQGPNTYVGNQELEQEIQNMQNICLEDSKINSSYCGMQNFQQAVPLTLPHPGTTGEPQGSNTYVNNEELAQEIQKMQNISLEDSKINASYDLRFLPLLNILNQFRDIVNEEQKFLEEIDEKTFPSKTAFQEIISKHQKGTNMLFKATMDLIKKETEKQVDAYLSELLMERFNMISARKKHVEKNIDDLKIKDENKKQILFTPLSKDFRDHQRSFINQSEICISESLASYDVATFELTNLLIKEFFKKCTKNELTPGTIY